MTPQLATVALDCLLVRLFERIEETNLPWLTAAAERLRAVFGEALVELVPSYTTLLVQYDLLVLDERQARERVEAALVDLDAAPAQGGRRHELPVWYHPSVGPDLERLAARAGMGIDELIRHHGARDYAVFALGFAPGFAFLGLVEEALAAPRLASPRPRVAAGSVGIAERQTAVYPLASPGGWNLIGRCPLRLFDPAREGYSLLLPGDCVRFVAIGHAEFVRLGGDDNPLEGP
ncbi:5-oxoprolinase subunit PxpB [Stutzerimonas tarimensis]|uniref:5-oxoprolinase subunit PxpB n=1 Tax=Stutzerimonas tarimensis TaxID=1507735 RepID=A0ABV7T8X6_9GAMM